MRASRWISEIRKTAQLFFHFTIFQYDASIAKCIAIINSMYRSHSMLGRTPLRTEASKQIAYRQPKSRFAGI